jgi:circadian clock protein KaiB
MNNQEETLLRLYIIEKSPTALETVSKLKSVLEGLKGTYQLEVIDILKSPEMIINDNILASPTLIRVKPLPPKRIVGSIPFNSLISEFDLCLCEK